MSSDSAPTLIQSLVPEQIRSAILTEGDVDCLRQAVHILETTIANDTTTTSTKLRRQLGKNRKTIIKQVVTVRDTLHVLANILEDEAKEQTNTTQIIEGDIP